MVRGGKIPMEFINDRKARLSTFLNRRKGLEKKARELSTLCDVQVGLIIHGPKDISSTKINKDPSLYPEDPNEIKKIINSFIASDPVERKRKSSDLSGYYIDKTKKARDELVKLQKDNAEYSHYPNSDHTYSALSVDQLHGFADQLETKIQAAKARLDSVKRARGPGLMGSGSNTNLYNDGKYLALCENNQLSSRPVPDTFGWSRVQADVIEPQELISHQEVGNLALCKNEQLSSWAVPDMFGWNSVQADVIEPQEVISHQEVGNLALCKNDQLSSRPVPDTFGWNSMQADVIEPQEVISHQGVGHLALCKNEQLSSWAVPDMFGWNSMQEPQEISHEGGGLYLLPFENAMPDSPGTMWSNDILFNVDLENKRSYNSWPSSYPNLFDMGLESEAAGRYNNNLMAGCTDDVRGIFENQLNDDYLLLPSIWDDAVA